MSSVLTAPQPGAAADGSFSQRMVLGGTSFTFNFRYNARMNRWIADILDGNGNMLLSGRPVLTGQPLWNRYSGIIPGLPQGVMVAIDTTGNGCDPTEFNFGGDVQLIYIPPA